MRRGEIWWGVWPTDELVKPRPLLIVSNNHRNSGKNIRDVVVVNLTSLSRADGSQKPTNDAEDYLITFKKPSIIRCSSIYKVKKNLLKSKLHQLTPDQMSQIDTRLKTVLDLH